jgi:hypothetical protein
LATQEYLLADATATRPAPLAKEQLQQPVGYSIVPRQLADVISGFAYILYRKSHLIEITRTNPKLAQLSEERRELHAYLSADSVFELQGSEIQKTNCELRKLSTTF